MYLLILADGEDIQVETFADKQSAGEEYFLCSALTNHVFLYEVSVDGGKPSFRQIPPQEVKYPRSEPGGKGMM